MRNHYYSLGWRVGNDWTINSRSHNWVMKDGIPPSPLLLNDDMSDFKAGNLIRHDVIAWNFKRVCEIFNHNSLKVILNIPLLKSKGVNMLYFIQRIAHTRYVWDTGWELCGQERRLTTMERVMQKNCGRKCGISIAIQN